MSHNTKSTGDVNNIHYLITVTAVRGGIVAQTAEKMNAH